jgi:hypothetical protein
MPTDKMSGSISVVVRVTNVDAAQRISDILDEHSCSPSWDVRLIDTEDHEMDLLDQLVAKANKRKTVYEKLLGKKLKNVIRRFALHVGRRLVELRSRNEQGRRHDDAFDHVRHRLRRARRADDGQGHAQGLIVRFIEP